MNNTIKRFPAEWEKQEAIILAWPFNKSDWPGKFTPIFWVYTEIIKKIASDEKVILLVPDKKEKTRCMGYLLKNSVNMNNVMFLEKILDRNWMRDSAPITILETNENSSSRTFVHFSFNAWAKYDNWKKDKTLPSFLSRRLTIPLVDPIYKNRRITLEGGAIDTNGNGTIITTEECLLHPSIQVRNPGFTKSDYADAFSQYLGVSNIIWLKDGIIGDDTHGHIDDVCRFINRDSVVLCWEKNSKDENYRILEENFERLQSAKLEDGSKVNVIPLPMPEPLIFDGMRLPASYANFLICNETVLVPTFNDVNDKLALGILTELFPERKVVGINSVDLVWGLGTLHCLSHELPAEPLKN